MERKKDNKNWTHWPIRPCVQTSKLSFIRTLIFFIHQYRAFSIIYNVTNDCTIISNTIITNNMLLHVSTFKMSSSGSSFCLAKVTYRFSGLSKMRLLKYKMINFNKMMIVQRNERFAQWLYIQATDESLFLFRLG